jgi:hypothetical protein
MTTTRRLLIVISLALLPLIGTQVATADETCDRPFGAMFNPCADLDTSHITDLR